MIWLVIALVVVGLPVATLLFGAESRDGHDWKPLYGLSSPLPDANGRLVPGHRRVKQG